MKKAINLLLVSDTLLILISILFYYRYDEESISTTFIWPLFLAFPITLAIIGLMMLAAIKKLKK